MRRMTTDRVSEGDAVLRRIMGKVRGFAPARQRARNYVVIFCGWDPEYGDVFSWDCRTCCEHESGLDIGMVAAVAEAHRWTHK